MLTRVELREGAGHASCSLIFLQNCKDRHIAVIAISFLPHLTLQAVDRRATLGLFAAAAALAGAKPSEAAYGDQARVFAGKITNKSGKSFV